MDDNRYRKLSPDDVRAIRKAHAEGTATQAGLARKYGVTSVAIYAVLQRRTHKHVTDE